MEEAVEKVMQFIKDERCKDENAMVGFIVNMLGEMYSGVKIQKSASWNGPPTSKIIGIEMKRGNFTIMGNICYLVKDFNREDFKHRLSRFLNILNHIHASDVFNDNYKPQTSNAHLPHLKKLGRYLLFDIINYTKKLLGADSEVECDIKRLGIKNDRTIYVYMLALNEESAEQFVDAALQLHAFLTPLPDVKVAIQ